MTATDIAAWWGAAVATAVLAWDVWKWVRTGARLQTVIRLNVAYRDGRVIRTQPEGDATVTELATYCHIEIRNAGDRPTTLISVAGTHRPGKDQGCVFVPVMQLGSHHGPPLPALLGPGEIWTGAIEMDMLQDISGRGVPIVQIRASHLSKTREVPIAIDHVQNTIAVRTNGG